MTIGTDMINFTVTSMMSSSICLTNPEWNKGITVAASDNKTRVVTTLFAPYYNTTRVVTALLFAHAPAGGRFLIDFVRWRVFYKYLLRFMGFVWL